MALPGGRVLRDADKPFLLLVTFCRAASRGNGYRRRKKDRLSCPSSRDDCSRGKGSIQLIDAFELGLSARSCLRLPHLPEFPISIRSVHYRKRCRAPSLLERCVRAFPASTVPTRDDGNKDCCRPCQVMNAWSRCSRPCTRPRSNNCHSSPRVLSWFGRD